MSFQPVVPIGGIAGWTFLNRTLARQEEAFEKTPALQRDTDYFRTKILQVESFEALVEDRRLLRVALGAFGLSEDINNRAFIRKILSDGTEDSSALANRLTDKRYLKFAQAFQFISSRSTDVPADPAKLVSQYNNREFEAAIGAQNETMRFALALQRDLPEIVAGSKNQRAQWFSLMGNPPMRKVFDTAFGFPKEFAALDIDQQYTRYRVAALRMFGTDNLADFTDKPTLDKLTRRFLVMSELRESIATVSSASTALTLLSQANLRPAVGPLGAFR